MKKLITIFGIILLTTSLFSQALPKRHEIGLYGGASYYKGDLNQNAVIGELSPSFGVVYRYLYNERWAFRLHGMHGTITGNDATNKEEFRSRNLMFKSPVTEFGAMAELNFLPFSPGGSRNNFTPFLFGGLAVFSFNPMARYDGPWSRTTPGDPYEGWYELQPLGTEGQGSTEYPDRHPYSLTQVSIPFGLGIKWSISPSFGIALEWGMRKTFTDYLDDVSTTYVDPAVLSAENTEIAMFLANRSFEIGGVEEYGNQYPIDAAQEMVDMQRGNSEADDWYSFLGLTISFNIRGSSPEICPAYKNYHQYREYYLF